ncbi:MAG: hypothetical protein GY779_15330 [Gammaproteobacteria bacterium]|nr:hypothetical protein [Gammaproteobacteria bacterium]
MGPSHGHGHADALSLTMDIDGQGLLVDTGTFSYTGVPEWRRYFRSTPAHNTVCIDGLDQAQQTTAFQWSKPYTAELVRSHITEDGVVYLQARHNGYAGLGVEHVRYLIVIPDRMVIVSDLIEGEGRHKLDLYWHLAAEPMVDDETLRFDGYAKDLQIRLQDNDFSLHKGELKPICGWRSRCYGIREPITTIKKQYDGDLPHEFVTIIELADEHLSKQVIQSHLEKARTWGFTSSL